MCICKFIKTLKIKENDWKKHKTAETTFCATPELISDVRDSIKINRLPLDCIIYKMIISFLGEDEF